jgi:hypothetical protein
MMMKICNPNHGNHIPYSSQPAMQIQVTAQPGWLQSSVCVCVCAPERLWDAKVCNREGKVSMIRLAFRAAGMQDDNEGGIEGYNEGDTQRAR